MTQTLDQHLSPSNRPWRTIVWLAAAALLLVPLVAMQFTAEVRWTASDFVFAGVLLFGSLGTFELLTRRSTRIAYHAGIGLTLLGIVLLVWINAAVGIVGSEDNPANLMFAGVIGIGAIVALATRLHAHGMVSATLAMALTQLLVGGIALSGIAGPVGASGPAIVGLTIGLAGLWIGAATLFGRASR